MIKRLLTAWRGSAPRGRMAFWPAVRARFDSAQTTGENRRHWQHADGLAPNAAVSPEVRRILRNRARYEVANNSYARGMVLSLAEYTVGTGPRLQMLSEDGALNRRVEGLFRAWAEEIGLDEKLRTMRMAKADAGEAFARLVTNNALASPVKLDLSLIEADQVASPFPPGADPGSVDGVLYDADGNPAAYHVLRRHPGDSAAWSDPLAFEVVDADQMLHYYRPDRPGQCRGIPDLTPALPLFALLRRYTLAVIHAAETAAQHAAVIYTEAPPGGEAEEVDTLETVELERNMATVMPAGWKLGQMDAVQPTTTYAQFKGEILNEIARCLNMPYNVAAGNSSGYNYASGRLDHQSWYRSIRVEQRRMRACVLDRVLQAWLREAVLIEDLLPQSLRTVGATAPHTWFWDGLEHVDPAKEANAQATRLSSHTTTLAHEFARQGLDWEEELRQRAREIRLMRELGLPMDTTTPGDQPPEEATDARDAEEVEEPVASRR
ncbi:MAG: hypothetical protein AMXMBFR77_26930 [Phycisphaerales bacterium]